MTAVATKVDAKMLADALARVAILTRGRTTLPVLSTVLIESVEDGLRLTTTDLDQWAEIVVPCDAPGLDLVVPARPVLDALKTMRGEVDLSESEGSLRLGTRFRFQCMPRNEFPDARIAPDEPTHHVGSEDRDALVTASAYVSHEISRPIIGGVFLDGERGNVAATNGHNIIVIEGGWPKGMPATIASTAAIKAARSLMGTEDIGVRRVADRIEFTQPGVRLVGKTVPGQYPDYVRVVSSNEGREFVTLTASRAALIAAVEAVGVVGTRRDHPRITLHLDGEPRVTAEASDLGAAEIPIDGATVEGEPFAIGLNPHYVLRALGDMAGEDVTLRMGSPERVVAFFGTEDDPQIHVMPLRILDR